MPMVKILCIGDVVGKPGRRIIRERLPDIIRLRGINFVVANVENASGGGGVKPEDVSMFLDAGVDVMTCGDHVWDKKEMIEFIPMQKSVLRPLNFPDTQPGSGCVLIKKDGVSYCVIHVVGRVFMKYYVDSPFTAAERALAGLAEKPNVVIVDFHAEATSEKVAAGWFFDGKASVVFGTHTHVPTADEVIHPKGTAFISDVGMTGPYKSIIGRQIDKVLKRMITQMPVYLDVATEDIRMYGFMVDVDSETGRAVKIEKFVEKLPA